MKNDSILSVFSMTVLKLESNTKNQPRKPFNIKVFEVFYLLLPLNCGWWLTRDIIDNSIDSRNFIYNSSGYNI